MKVVHEEKKVLHIEMSMLQFFKLLLLNRKLLFVKLYCSVICSNCNMRCF